MFTVSVLGRGDLEQHILRRFLIVGIALSASSYGSTRALRWRSISQNVTIQLIVAGIIDLNGEPERFF